MAPYAVTTYASLLGTPGFSDELLTTHFGLYEGYVKNVNTLAEKLTDASQAGTPGWSEMKRRFGWEWNGMRLHELYFDNMSKTPGSLPEGTLKGALIKYWGSYDAWLKDFKATGTMRGIGWTILYHDPASRRLFNAWVEEHAMGHLAGSVPLLVLDVFEHAYVLDYGMKRAEYIDAFTAAVDWETVTERFGGRH
jgi:Fe-Mn family superoxide dismutase